jgi:hypothetical protein
MFPFSILRVYFYRSKPEKGEKSVFRESLENFSINVVDIIIIMKKRSSLLAAYRFLFYSDIRFARYHLNHGGLQRSFFFPIPEALLSEIKAVQKDRKALPIRHKVLLAFPNARDHSVPKVFSSFELVKSLNSYRIQFKKSYKQIACFQS